MTLWLRTDEEEEAIWTMERVPAALASVRDDLRYWGEVVRHVHHALQSFMVLALQGSNGFRALSAAGQREWSRSRQEGRAPNPRRLKLDRFMELYKKIKSEDMLMFINSSYFVATPAQDESVKMLHETFRNEFEHFKPKKWSIAVGGFPKMCLDCLDVICFIERESGNVHWGEGAREKRFEAAVGQARAHLLELQEEYNGSPA